MTFCWLNLVTTFLLILTLSVVLGSAAADEQQQQCTSSDGSTTCSSSSTGRRYTATQYINFNINTSGGLASAGECKDLPVDPNTGYCYIGNHNSIEQDLLRRLEIIKILLDRMAFDLISDHKYIDSRPDVLKIFMVPEFYMRGPYGAVSLLFWLLCCYYLVSVALFFLTT